MSMDGSDREVQLIQSGDTVAPTQDSPFTANGQPTIPPSPYPSMYYMSSPGQIVLQAPPSNGKATGGFVCSLIAVVTVVVVPLGIIGLVLSCIGLNTSRSIGTGKGLAIAGIVLSLLQLLSGLFVLLIIWVRCETWYRHWIVTTTVSLINFKRMRVHS